MGAVVLILVPFLERSDSLYLSERKFWTWMMSTLAYSLLALWIWGYFYPETPVAVDKQALVFGIPTLIIAVVIGLSHKLKKGALRTRAQTQKITPYSVLGTAVVILMFSGGFAYFVMRHALFSLFLIIPLFTLVYHSVIRMVRAFNNTSITVASPMTKRTARLELGVITAVSVILFALLPTLPSVGMPSTYAGLDLGVVMFLWGYAINRYHRMIYGKD